jgi:hypothetical protein
MKRHATAALLAAFCLATAGAARAGEPESLQAIAERYARAQQRAMEKDATAADVDAVLAFCTDSFRYVHPAFGAQVDGKDAARKGMLSHLGETSDADLSILKSMVSDHSVALDVKTSFVVVETGKRVERRNLIVLAFEGDRISLRADF